MTRLTESQLDPDELPEGRIQPGDARHSEYLGHDSERQSLDERRELARERLRGWGDAQRGEPPSQLRGPYADGYSLGQRGVSRAAIDPEGLVQPRD